IDIVPKDFVNLRTSSQGYFVSGPDRTFVHVNSHLYLGNRCFKFMGNVTDQVILQFIQFFPSGNVATESLNANYVVILLHRKHFKGQPYNMTLLMYNPKLNVHET